jgi:hypothetical protein
MRHPLHWPLLNRCFIAPSCQPLLIREMPPQRRQSQSVGSETGIHSRLRGDDLYEMLAWLDYCVAKGFGPERFKRSIVDHLKRSRQRDFTLAQIDERIRNLWKFNPKYKVDQSDYSCVYRVGTKALSFLDYNEVGTKFVRARIRQMMKEPIFESSKLARKRSRRTRTVKHISPGVEVGNRTFQKAKRALGELPLDSTLQALTPRSSTLQVSSNSHGSRIRIMYWANSWVSDPSNSEQNT